MITENIVLKSESKKQLKHLSIDNDIYVSTMLIDAAKYILNNDKKVVKLTYDECEPFTMKIDEGLKDQIKQFCKEKDVKIKDFWNEAADIAIQKEGVFFD